MDAKVKPEPQMYADYSQKITKATKESHWSLLISSPLYLRKSAVRFVFAFIRVHSRLGFALLAL
jgi:hypothetical protein